MRGRRGNTREKGSVIRATTITKMEGSWGGHGECQEATATGKIQENSAPCGKKARYRPRDVRQKKGVVLGGRRGGGKIPEGRGLNLRRKAWGLAIVFRGNTKSGGRKVTLVLDKIGRQLSYNSAKLRESSKGLANIGITTWEEGEERITGQPGREILRTSTSGSGVVD